MKIISISKEKKIKRSILNGKKRKCDNCGTIIEIEDQDKVTSLKGGHFIPCPICKKWIVIKIHYWWNI